jgi:hypothetical protein
MRLYMKYYQNIALLLLLTIMLTGTASAATTTPNDARRMEVREKVKEFKAKGASTSPEGGFGRSCENLSNRIDTRLSNYREKYARHKAAYIAHREKLVQISAKLEAEGIITTKLRADIAILEGKVNQLETDHLKVKAALETAKNLSCTDSKKEFKAAVQAVREAQKEVSTDARTIFEFIRGTLRTDVIELQAEYKNK